MGSWWRTDVCLCQKPGMTEKMSISVSELTLTLAAALASAVAFNATENPTEPIIGTSEWESPTAMQVDKGMLWCRQYSTTNSRLSYLSKYRFEVCHHLATAPPGKLFRLAVGNTRVGDFLGSITALEVGEERTVPQAVSEMLRH
jgi:hypothetical protein